MTKSNKKALLIICVLLIIIVILISTILIFLIPSKKEEKVIKEPEKEEINIREVEKPKNERKKEYNPSVINKKIKSMIKMHQQKIEGNTLLVEQDINIDDVITKYKNENIVGRLEVPSLFNVLIVQAQDNQFYLNHDLYGEYDIKGSEFIDYRVNIDSKQINIYGNNSNDESAKSSFSLFEKFLDKDFFDNNPYIIFQHNKGKDIYKIISIRKLSNRDKTVHMQFNNNSNFTDNIKDIAENGEIINNRKVNYDENSQIIVIQTCINGEIYLITSVKI